MSFTEKLINVTFTLKSGNFKGTSSNTLKLTGLRVSSRVGISGAPAMGQSQTTIYGMTKTQMDQLSTLGAPPNLTFANSILVEVGDASGVTTLISSTIQNSWADYSGSPQVAFIVEAYTGLAQSATAPAATSIKGSADCATLMGTLAKQAGLTLENNGVTAQIVNPYFRGDLRAQIDALAKAGDFYAHIDANGTLAIWPKNGMRAGQTVVISPTSGLKGYPTFQFKSISFECEYNPLISYGKQVQVQSSLQAANGMWIPVKINSFLESQTPGGSWFSSIRAYSPGIIQAAP